MRSDPKFRKNMVVPIRPVSQQQFVNTYPRWMPRDDTDAVDDVHLVSQASLFWYNNAVATATEPFSVRETGTNLGAFPPPFFVPSPSFVHPPSLCTLFILFLCAQTMWRQCWRHPRRLRP